jgi:hypothetical protein
MSFLNENLPNDLSSRFKKIYSDEFWIKSENGSFIPFQPGGGGESTLPYYVKPDKIKLENESNSTEVLESGININNQVLNENNLTELNKIFNKTMWLTLLIRTFYFMILLIKIIERLQSQIT